MYTYRPTDRQEQRTRQREQGLLGKASPSSFPPHRLTTSASTISTIPPIPNPIQSLSGSRDVISSEEYNQNSCHTAGHRKLPVRLSLSVPTPPPLSVRCQSSPSLSRFLSIWSFPGFFPANPLGDFRVIMTTRQRYDDPDCYFSPLVVQLSKKAQEPVMLMAKGRTFWTIGRFSCFSFLALPSCFLKSENIPPLVTYVCTNGATRAGASILHLGSQSERIKRTRVSVWSRQTDSYWPKKGMRSDKGLG